MKITGVVVFLNGVEPIPPTPAPMMGVLSMIGFLTSAAGLVILTFIFVSILLLRDRVLMSKRTGGAVTLTLASIILLSGIWCYALSPTVRRYEHDSIVRGEKPTIGASQIQTYYVELKEGERLTGDVSHEEAAFTLRIYDPEGDLIRSALNVTTSGLTVEALRSGSYRVEIENPNPESITPYIYIGKETEVPHRLLAPAGQWLSIISIPLFALGLWAVRYVKP